MMICEYYWIKCKEIKITNFYKIYGDGKGVANGATGNITVQPF